MTMAVYSYRFQKTLEDGSTSPVYDLPIPVYIKPRFALERKDRSKLNDFEVKAVEWMLTVAGEQDPKLVDQQLAESFIDQVVDKTEMTSLTLFFKGSALKKII